MKTIFFIFLLCAAFQGFCQQIKSVSISRYVNSELYLKGGVIGYLADKNGNPSPSGKYVTLYNSNKKPFYFSTPAASGLKQLNPNQKIIVAVGNQNAANTVKLVVKYSEDENVSLSKKIGLLSVMNAETDRNLSHAPNPADKTINQSIAKAIAELQKLNTTQSVAATNFKAVKNTPAPTGSKKLPVKPLPVSKAAVQLTTTKPALSKGLECFYITEPAYYTFYYLKTKKEVLYTEPFAVGAYFDESSGKEMLQEALFCLEERLKKQFDDLKFDQLITDPNHILESGFIHLRNYTKPSSTVREQFAYTANQPGAKNELIKWIKYERSRNKGLKFIKID